MAAGGAALRAGGGEGSGLGRPLAWPVWNRRGRPGIYGPRRGARAPGSEMRHARRLFHKGLYGFGNLNTVEAELNWKQKSLSLYILEEKNSIKWDFSGFNTIGLPFPR